MAKKYILKSKISILGYYCFKIYLPGIHKKRSWFTSKRTEGVSFWLTKIHARIARKRLVGRGRLVKNENIIITDTHE